MLTFTLSSVLCWVTEVWYLFLDQYFDTQKSRWTSWERSEWDAPAERIALLEVPDDPAGHSQAPQPGAVWGGNTPERTSVWPGGGRSWVFRWHPVHRTHWRPDRGAKLEGTNWCWLKPKHSLLIIYDWQFSFAELWSPLYSCFLAINEKKLCWNWKKQWADAADTISGSCRVSCDQEGCHEPKQRWRRVGSGSGFGSLL